MPVTMSNPELPQWLKALVAQNKAALRCEAARAVSDSITAKSLRTVCHDALCPNKGKCFSEGGATFLILGGICTRGCRFCAVERGVPPPPDETEPEKIAEAIAGWKLRYAVITSPTRDDLPDGGAAHFAKTITAIRQSAPQCLVEPLIPDFAGQTAPLETVLAAKPAVLAHNMETVPRLYAEIRKGADYRRSLEVISNSKRIAPEIPAKSGIMLGLGETAPEIEAVLRDLRAAGCDILTLGQYLAPSRSHVQPERYLELSEFADWGKKAEALGFAAVSSGPLVRSSYLAGEMYRKACGNKR